VSGSPQLPPFVAHYPFDNSATDASGNGRTATLFNTTYVTGRSGSALNLNGTSAYASLPSGILAGASDFSVALWVRLDAVTAWTRLFDFGTGTNSYMFLSPRSGTGTLRFAITTGGAGAEQQINGPAALTAGVWTHVAITRNGNLGILYVNGAEVARNTGLTLGAGSLGSTSQNWLGRSQYADPYLDGALDNVRLYSRALTASEVSAFAANGS
jgi:hypothetical protein